MPLVTTNDLLYHIRFYFRLACFTYFLPLPEVDKNFAAPAGGASLSINKNRRTQPNPRCAPLPPPNRRLQRLFGTLKEQWPYAYIWKKLGLLMYVKKEPMFPPLSVFYYLRTLLFSLFLLGGGGGVSSSQTINLTKFNKKKISLIPHQGSLWG